MSAEPDPIESARAEYQEANRPPELKSIISSTIGAEGVDDAGAGVVEPIPNRFRDRLLLGSAIFDQPELEPIVNRVLNRDNSSMLVGPPAAGKTFLAVDLACSLVTGKEWCGYTTHDDGRLVVILAGEGARGWAKRLTGWCEHHGHNRATVAQRLAIVPGGGSLHLAGDGRDMVELMAELDPQFIIVDTFARHAVGANENDASDMGLFIGALDAIRDACNGAHVMGVHHTGKSASAGARGSSALLGAVDTEITVSGGHPPEPIEVTVTKQRDQEMEPEWSVRFEHVAGTLVPLVCAAGPPPMKPSEERLDKLVELLRATDDGDGVAKGKLEGYALEEKVVTSDTMYKRDMVVLLERGRVVKRPGHLGRYSVATEPEPQPEPLFSVGSV
jgi:hypothetical protein